MMKKDRDMFAILNLANNSISKEAVIVMLENGILTEERLFSDYIMALNVWNCLTYQEECMSKNTQLDAKLKKRILIGGLQEKEKENINRAWDNYFQNNSEKE